MSVLFLEQSWAFRGIDFDSSCTPPPPPPQNIFPKLSLEFSSMLNYLKAPSLALKSSVLHSILGGVALCLLGVAVHVRFEEG